MKYLASLALIVCGIGTAVGQTRTVTTPGSYNWVCPPNVTQVTVECWGAGGGGGSSTTVTVGGGGGGGYAKKINVPVTSGLSYAFVVGTGGPGAAASSNSAGSPGGDTYFINTGTVVGHGGGGGTTGASGGGAGGTGANGTGANHFDGGTGSIGTGTRGGGGGGSAGTAANGNSVTNAQGGAAAVAGGGGGGDGSNGSANGQPGGAPGGGGGGTDAGTGKGGDGADGKFIFTYTDATPPTATIAKNAGQADPTNNSALQFLLTFNEEVDPATVKNTSIVLTGAAASVTGITNPLGDNMNYVVAVTATGQGTVNATVHTQATSSGNAPADWAGNKLQAPTPTAATVLFDSQAPTIPNSPGITSPDANGLFLLNSLITITVQFSEPVIVTGFPQLLLATTPTPRNATYVSGSGTNILTFNYTVQTNDVSADLDYASNSALSAGTSIKDAAGNNATLTLPNPNTTGSLRVNKNLQVDGTGPTVTSVTTSKANGTYGTGTLIAITVNFSGAVAITSGTPTLTLETGTTDAVVNYTSGATTSALLFNYTVAAGESSPDLDYQAINSLVGNITKNGAPTIPAILTLPTPGAAGALGNPANIVIDAIQPKITNVTSPLADGTYYLNKVVPITITLDKSVTVSGGPPVLSLNTTPGRNATYASGSPSNTLTFNYTVVSGDVSADLNYLSAASLSLGGGSIKDALNNDADLTTLPAPAAAGSLGTNKNIVIDGASPIVLSVTSSKADGLYGIGTLIPVVVTFSSAVDVDITGGTPQILMETGAVDRNAAYASGTGTTTLTFNYTVQSNDVSADLDYNTVATINLNSGTIVGSGAGPAAILTLPAPGATGSISPTKAIVIDGVRPVATTPTSAAQRLKAGATSTSTIQTSKNGDIYLVRSSVAIGNSLANLTAAVAAKDAFKAITGATAGNPNFVLVPGSGTANDGLYDVVAVDAASNVSNQVGGWLTIDNTPPLATATPTSAAAPVIDGVEYSNGFTVRVSGLTAAGALIGDRLDLLLGGSPFPSALFKVLNNTDISTNDYVDFTITCNQLGADGTNKLISAKITDVATNPGAVSPDLSVDLATTPTTAASAMTFTGTTTTSVTVNFANGDGKFRLLVASVGTPVTFVPAAGTTYSPNNNYGLATSPGPGIGRIVGTASGTNVVNIPSGNTIYFTVFEYSNCPGRENYLTASTLTGNVAIPAGALSTIIPVGGAGIVSSVTNSLAAANAASASFSFSIKDDGSTPGVDNAATIINSLVIRRDITNDQMPAATGWSNIIAGVVLTDGTNPINSSADVTSFPGGYLQKDDITISNIPAALGTVGDNATKNYQVKLWFNTSIPFDIDNLRLVLTLDDADISTAAIGSSAMTNSSATSGALNNVIQVIASKLSFTTIPAGGNAGSPFGLAVQATDANGNVDLDMNQQVTITAPTVPASGAISFATASPAAAAQNLVAGKKTWSNVQVTAAGTYQFRVADTDVSLPNMTQFTSGNITFGAASNASDIVENTLFAYPKAGLPYNAIGGFDYQTYQHATAFTLGAPPPADAIRVAEFIIRDGGISLSDADFIGTTLTNITFAVTNPGNIRHIGIFDGTNIVDTKPAAASVSFSGLSLLADDVDNGGTGTKTFALYVSFNNTVTDDVHFGFQVTAVGTNSGGSTFPSAGSAQSSTSVFFNTVTVQATQLAYVVGPSSTLLNQPMSTVTVQAIDAAGSRDLDFNSGVTLTSTGVPSAIGSITLGSGVGSNSTLKHTDKGTGLTMSATAAGVAGTGPSSAFNITASNLSDIVPDNTTVPFTVPSNIPYDTYQANNITGGINDVAVAQFAIRDGGTAGSDLDGAGTIIQNISFSLSNSAMLKRVALYNDAGIELGEVAAAPTVTFTGINYGTTDDNDRLFTIRVSFQNVVTDNTQFQFQVTSVTSTSQSSDFFNATGGAAQSSIASNDNRIEVTATQYVFLTAPTASVFANIPFASPIVLEARDVLSNKDLDYAKTIDITNSGAIPMTDAAGHTSLTTVSVPFVGGGLTLNNQFRFDHRGLGSATLQFKDPNPPNTTLTSSTITINVATASDIIESTPISYYTANINYLSFQAGTINLTSAGDEVLVARFKLRDGGTGVDADGVGTTLTQLTINVPNSAFIKQLGLYKGPLESDRLGAIMTVAGSTVTFSGFSLTAPDDNSATLDLYATFNNAITDNTKISFSVNTATVSSITSLLPTGTTGNAGGAFTSNPGVNDNRMEVTATKIFYVSPSGATAININQTLSVQLEARDINNNLDLDFASAVSSITPAQPLTTSPSPATSASFAAGVLNFGFQYLTASPTGAGNGTLTMAAGPISGQVSPAITVSASSESQLYFDPIAGSYTTNINYWQHQQASNPNTFILGRMILSDGDADGTPGDADLAPTVLNSFQISMTNPTAVRRIALYDNSGVEIASTETNGAATVSFSGLTITAPDDNAIVFTIRASFNNTPATIVDNQQIAIQVTNAVEGVGSNFKASAGYIGGVNGGSTPPPTVNFIEVTASKLDFILGLPGRGPAAIVGVETLNSSEAGVIHARDQYDIVDLDFNAPAIITAPATVSGTFVFSAGVLDLQGIMNYGGTGGGVNNGTLLVTAGGLASNTTGSILGKSNNSVVCPPVDVIHITTTNTFSGINSTNLLAGSTQKVVFGFTLNAPHTIGGSPNEPRLSQFIISFNTSISGIYSNPVIREGTSNIYSAVLPDIVTTPTINATINNTGNQLIVTFPAGKERDLRANPNLSYFLSVDVSITASGSTPQLTASLNDFGSTDLTNGGLVTVSNVGTQFSNTVGKTISFSSVAPPTLASSYPALGQSNIDITQSAIELTFSVPTIALDRQVVLKRKSNGQLITLTIPPYSGPAPPPAGYLNPGSGSTQTGLVTLSYPIPAGTLVYDEEYSILIAPGALNTTSTEGTGTTGVMDENRNMFPGIGTPGTLYFRTVKRVAPYLLGSSTASLPAPAPGLSTSSDPVVTNITVDGAVLNATFDKVGKAYFMVVNNTTTAPTAAQIKAGTYPSGTVFASGNFAINSTVTVPQFGVINPTGGPGGKFPIGTYYVWMCAEASSEANHILINNTLPANAVMNSGAYGSSANLFVENTGGPTLSFTVNGAATPTTPWSNNPTIGICSNSYQVLNSPIIISEGGIGNFSAAGAQQFNLVLPAGFQFDVSTTAGLPNYGTLTLQGSDFVGGSMTFLSNTILKVTFQNLGAASNDKIIISGLRVISNGSATGGVFRLGGTVGTFPAITDGTNVAFLSASDAPALTFDNAYSIAAFNADQAHAAGPPPNPVETAIPDNVNPSLVVLTPYLGTIAAKYDFGPSVFSGQGVTGNQLNVTSITPDIPFNITITHTDNNGCISTNPVQYVVYDHTKAINVTQAGAPSISPYCADNPNFVVNQTNPVSGATNVVRDVTYNNLTGYYMEKLQADILPGSPGVMGGAENTDWISVINSATNPLLVRGAVHVFGGLNYYDYSFDDKVILNAAQTNSAIKYPYDNFKQTTTSGKTYYDGGLLGKIEFTGTFRNISNPTVQIRKKQIIDVYIPPVPLVETTTAPASIDNTVPSSPIPIYCAQGGPIAIQAWPPITATTVNAVGILKIYDATTGPFPGTPIVGAGFTDFTNGSGELKPNLIDNRYKDIRIEYFYHDGAGVCPKKAYQLIRISPNPVVNYGAVSLASPYVDGSVTNAFCSAQSIQFTSTVTFPMSVSLPPTAPPASVTVDPLDPTAYAWNFQEPTGVKGTAIVPNPVYSYNDPTTYNPTLQVKSTDQCLSTVASVPITVGGIPTVGRYFTGIHVGDLFHFQSFNSSVSGNDHFRKLDWTFGDGNTASYTAPIFNGSDDPTFNTKDFTHTYSSPGEKVYDLKVTSVIGCVNSLSLVNQKSGMTPGGLDDNLTRTLVVLPRQVITPANAYKEDFETTLAQDNWRAWYVGDYAPAPNRSPDRSWVWGTPAKAVQPSPSDPPSKAVIVPDPANNGSKIWVTSLVQTYNPQERTAVYSPSFDLTALKRPMISFDTFTQMETSDGVVLEYSTDDKNIVDPTKTWKTLGNQTSGEFWYSDKGIASKPGKQSGNDFGWSGISKDTWLNSKHALVEPVANIPTIITAPKVVFRFALASARTTKASITTDGFAFDNVRIGERTRTILLESFTSSSNATRSPATTPSGQTDEQYENGQIALFNSATVGLEVVKLNYHMNFPGNDPFNLDNPADPSSRALFYNIESTPQSRLDGYFPPPYTPFSVWGGTSFGTRTLHLAQADIVIRPTAGGSNNQIVANGKVSVMIDIIPTVKLDAKTILHVGIVEQLVPKASLSTAQQALILTKETQWEYVLKKLLPTAAGTRTSTHKNAVNGVLVAGTLTTPIIYTFGPFELTLEPKKFYAPNKADLGIVAFLQKEDGDKEVYQAEIVKDLDDPAINVITAVEPVRAEDVKVFPVPASHELHVVMPGILAESAPLEMIDQTGRSALQSHISAGESKTTLNVNDLASGVYILQINVGNGNFTRKKVMVVHDGN